MKFDKIKKILNNEVCVSFTTSIDNDKIINTILEWIKSKDNTLVLYDKVDIAKYVEKFKNNKQIKSYTAEDAINRNKAKLISMLSLLVNRDYLYLLSELYFIFSSKRKLSILSIEFEQETSIENSSEIIYSLVDAVMEKQFLKEFNNIFIYFPFQVGNIFSKKRYIYEINSKYMESLGSYKSLGKNKSTVLKNYLTDKDHAILSEYHGNSSINYNSNYVYIDFIDILINTKNISTYYFENLIESKSFKVLNSIDRFYFYAVLNQQNEVYLSIANQIRLPENIDFKGSKYSFVDLVNKFIREINENKGSIVNFKELNKYLKGINQKSGYLYTLQKLYKTNSLNEYEKILFYKVAINFPLYDNKSYASHLANSLNYDDEIKVNRIAELIFGSNSTLYDNDDKRKVFFKDVKELFSIYNNSGYDRKSFKYLFNKSWITSVSKTLKKLLK